MENLYSDGYTILKNPSDIGGGFVIIGTKKAFYEEEIKKQGMTNNEAELLGVYKALQIADKNSIIYTDSQNTMAWIKSGKPKARPDLKEICQQAKKLKAIKNIDIKWVPRDENDAGIYIEEQQYEEQMDRFSL